MEKHYQFQLDRINRLLKIINSSNPHEQNLLGSLHFYDVIILTAQCIWHLKDWILNDTNFHAKDIQTLKNDIFAEKCLLICSDIANGSKHLTLKSPKTNYTLSDRRGLKYISKENIYMEYYYIVSENNNDIFHGLEIREFFCKCMSIWQIIINNHYYTDTDYFSNSTE